MKNDLLPACFLANALTVNCKSTFPKLIVMGKITFLPKLPV